MSSIDPPLVPVNRTSGWLAALAAPLPISLMIFLPEPLDKPPFSCYILTS